MQVNYLAPVQIMKILLPLMEQRRSGHIVNLASVASIQTGVNVQLFLITQLAEYVASKHALWGFHHSLRQELKMANSPIKTTIICPYAVDTGMVLNNIEEKFKGYSTLLDPIVPILKEDFVGRTVYESVVSGREVVFIRNAYNIILHLVRLLPWTLIDFLMILM
jgi:all-trans-retinol dehydrogenase (NAD+)